MSGAGADIHVIRDDGMHFRNLPWGRNGREHCQGHQSWIGRSSRALTSTAESDTGCARLIAGNVVSFIDHHGLAAPGGERNDFSRNLPDPHFYHFATDIAGTRLITDSLEGGACGASTWRPLPAAADAPVTEFTYLLNPRADWFKVAHVHPFLSPDRNGFFNSDESGVLQAYMVKLPY